MTLNNRLKSFSLYLAALITVVSNTVNYFYCYLYLDDILLQWKSASWAISSVLLLLSFYAWLSSGGLKKLVTGWLTFYLLINFAGVCLGYTLHTKGFMAVLFSAGFLAISHILSRTWGRYF